MEPLTKHRTKNIRPYLHLVPKAEVITYDIKKGAELKDTIFVIKRMIPLCAYQTERLAKIFDRNTLKETCRAIFDWIYDHIEYRRDQRNLEQVKTPQRTIYDGYGDCEDMQLLCCCILFNKKIPFKIRTTAYNADRGIQHIYPYAIIPGDKEVIMDCVAQKFDYEVPYLYKEDYDLPYTKNFKPMDLQVLNGTPEARKKIITNSIDADDLLEGYEDVGDLGKLKLFRSSGGSGKGKLKNVVKKIQNTKFAQTVRKGLHLTNKINPAAALLRTGILIALKTNLFRIAERLRYSYLTPQQVSERGLDMNKYNRLIDVRDQLEKIFFRAGGELKNFKKEMLTGRGNRDKQIPLSGFGSIDLYDYNQHHSPMQILGIDTYSSEIGGVEGLGELGEAFTAGAAVTAATGALTAIAALLKSIGDLRKKPAKSNGDKTSQNDSGEESASTDSSDPQSQTSTQDNPDNSFFKNGSDTTNGTKDNGSGVENKSRNADTPATTSTPDSSDNSSNTNSSQSDSSSGEQNTADETSNEGSDSARSASSNVSTTAKGKENILTKAGNWIKANPVPTVLGVLVATAGVVAIVKYFGKDGKESKHSKAQLAGLPHHKNKKAYYKGKVRTYRLK